MRMCTGTLQSDAIKLADQSADIKYRFPQCLVIFFKYTEMKPHYSTTIMRKLYELVKTIDNFCTTIPNKLVINRPERNESCVNLLPQPKKEVGQRTYDIKEWATHCGKLFIIGIKDVFECFMMDLNYRAAILKPRSPKG